MQKRPLRNAGVTWKESWREAPSSCFPAFLRPPGRKNAQSSKNGRRRDGIRYRLLHEPYLRAVALLHVDRKNGFGNGRIRSPMRNAGFCTHPDALPSPPRLPYRVVGKDAFSRTGSASWIRRATYNGHLSLRFRMVSRLAGRHPGNSMGVNRDQSAYGNRGRSLREKLAA